MGGLQLISGQIDTERPSPPSKRTWIENYVVDRSSFLHAMRVLGNIARRGRHLALLLVDLKRFQWVNDAFGLEVGDHVLEVVGEAIKRAVGAEGVVGRLDGGRFGVLAFLPSELPAIFESPQR